MKDKIKKKKAGKKEIIGNRNENMCIPKENLKKIYSEYLESDEKKITPFN